AARSTRATPVTSRTRPRLGAPGSTGPREPGAQSFCRKDKSGSDPKKEESGSDPDLSTADLAAIGEVDRTLGAAQRLRRRPGAAGVARSLDGVLHQDPAGRAARRSGGVPRRTRRTNGERGFLLADAGFIAGPAHAHAVGPWALVFVARGLGA